MIKVKSAYYIMTYKVEVSITGQLKIMNVTLSL